MNNILTFEDYKKMNIRQVESVIYRQFIEEDIKDESEVNEGFIRNAINKSAGKFIQNALADEIEKGKELEKSIKEALDGLNKGFEELEQRINADTERGKGASTKLSAIEKVKEAIKAVQSQAFDTLTMIGSEGEIDFAGFMGSASVAAAANFGILFSPIRSVFITRKAYKYFLGIIKQTIRRNLLVIQLNFDQFENLILQKSFESEEDSETLTKSGTLHDVISTLTEQLCGKDSKMFKKGKSKELKEYLEAFKKAQDIAIKQNRENTKNNPLRSLWEDQHNNTYTRTLEQIKQYINDDSQKELDALKNSITKMAGNDVELVPYGELLISAAEEYAIKTNHGINNNFIKMSSVFNLDNQKKLIDLIVAAQKEEQDEIERKKRNKETKELKEKIDKSIETGKKIYEETLKDSTKEYTLDMFEEEFGGEGIEGLKAFFKSEDGQEAYKEFISKNPLYKYLILDDITLNNFLNSINDLKVVEISDSTDFYDTIVKEEQALYYMMAERSIKDAIESIKSENYFGFDINKDDVKDNHMVSLNESNSFEAINEGSAKHKKVERLEKKVEELESLMKELMAKLEKAEEKGETKTVSEIEEEIESTKEEIENTEEEIESVETSNEVKKPSYINDILSKNLFPDGKKRYFLTFNGSGNGLFDILHKDFKTTIFTEDKDYVDNISADSKLTIFKLIHEQLKMGKSIASQFANYLIRLEAHMLLKDRKPWFVVKNNEELIKKQECFDINAKTIQNKKAFVEINQDDFIDIKKFIERFHNLSENDFDLESNEKKKEEK